MIYTSESMHDYQSVGSCAGINFVHVVHFKKKSLYVTVTVTFKYMVSIDPSCFLHCHGYREI